MYLSFVAQQALALLQLITSHYNPENGHHSNNQTRPVLQASYSSLRGGESIYGVNLKSWTMSGKCVTVQKGTNDPFMYMLECAKTFAAANQIWTLLPENGAYRMIGLYSDKCVNVQAGWSTDGARIHEWECDYSGWLVKSQLWTMERAWVNSDGVEYHKLIGVNSGKCMSIIPNGFLGLHSCEDNQLNQLWAFTPATWGSP